MVFVNALHVLISNYSNFILYVSSTTKIVKCLMCKALVVKIVFFLALFFMSSCAKQNRDIQILKIDPEKASAHELNEVLCITGITVLECNDSAFIGEVSDYLKYKNRSYVLDKKRKSVHIFDDMGRYVSRIYCYGDGPNEYHQLSCFYIDPFQNRLVLIDNSKKMRYLYSLTGEFLNTEKEHFAVKNVSFLSDGTKIVVRDIVDSGVKNGNVINVFKGECNVSSFLPFAYKSGTLVFEKSHPLVTVGNVFYYNSLMSDTIYGYNGDILFPKYIMDFSGKGVSNYIKDVSIDTFGESFYALLQNHPKDLAYWPQILGEYKGKFFLGYIYGNDMCFCVYDLINGTVNQFLGPYIGTISLTQISSGIFSSSNELFFILDNYKISLMDKSSMDEIKHSYPSLYESIKNISLDDNPVILSAKFKNYEKE